MDAPSIIEKHRGDLARPETIYDHIRSSPEPFERGQRAAEVVAGNLSHFKVHTKIGGFGVVAVFENGTGPTVALRAVLDELQTPALLAAAALLYSAREHWKGTLVCIFQPSELAGGSAQVMVVDGIWDPLKLATPLPTIILGHSFRALKSGTVALRSGPVVAAVDQTDIRIVGKGGHSARPDLCIDPIVIAASIVTRLQTIVSREAKPGQLAVISCGSIHGGDTAHIIPDHVDLQVTTRACSSEVQERLLQGIGKIVRTECTASGAQEDPVFTTIGHANPIINDQKLYRVLQKAFHPYFKGKLVKTDVSSVSEDFPMLANACKTRYLFWNVGFVQTEEQRKAGNEELGIRSPGPVSNPAQFAIQATLETAIDALALAALTFLGEEVGKDQ